MAIVAVVFAESPHRLMHSLQLHTFVGQDCLAPYMPAFSQVAVLSLEVVMNLSTYVVHTEDMWGRQGTLVNDMRYLASVVTQCFTAFGELLALHKRFAELTGGITR